MFCGFFGGTNGKESACSAKDPGSIPGLGRSPGEGNGNPLQYSCLENSMDGGSWRLHSMGSQRVGHDRLTSLASDLYQLQTKHKCIGMSSTLIPYYVDHFSFFHLLIWALLSSHSSGIIPFLSWQPSISIPSPWFHHLCGFVFPRRSCKWKYVTF